MPKFIRHDAHKKKRIGISWRRPRGRQSKMRLRLKSYARARSTGFGSPVAVKGLSRSGFTQNVVANTADFKDLNKTTDGVIISRTVGMLRRSELVDFAQKNGFKTLNISPDKFKKSFEAVLAAKKEHKKVISKRKESKEKPKSKKEDKKGTVKTTTPEESDEESKVKEKQEKDKLLTKRSQGD